MSVFWLGVFCVCAVIVRGQDTYDFGVCGDHESVAHTFCLRNMNPGKSMRITSVRSSCSCAVAQAEFAKVLPGATATVTCTINLKSLEGETAKNFWVRLAWENNEKTAEIMAAAEGDVSLGGNEAEIVLRMKGTVRPRVKFSPIEAVFHDGTPVTLQLLGYARTAVITAVTPPADSRFLYMIAPDQRSLTIRPKGELPRGSWLENWNVSVADDKVKELSVCVRSLTKAVISVVPEILTVRASDRKRQVLLRPLDRKTPFKVLSATIEPGGQPVMIQERGKSRWQIIVNGEAVSTLSPEARLVIRTDLQGEETITVPLVIAP